MNSEVLNRKISKICDVPSQYEAFGEKSIPYIGWFWRTVNFDADHCWLGILPAMDDGIEVNDKPRAGFMENNKWDYDTFKVEGDDWEEIKSLLEAAVTKPTTDNLKAVDDKIQSLL